MISDTAIVDNKSVLGSNVKIYRQASVVESNLRDDVSIGDESIIRFSNLDEKVEIGRRNTIDHVTIGKGTYTGEFCIIKYCSIGKYCSVSWNVSIGGANHEIERLSSSPLHRIFGNPAEQYKSFEEEQINIGNDVWIASGVTINRGVKVGDGAVIGAGAVVTKDVPPYAVVVGVPAKVLRFRFEQRIIDELLEIKWWNWPQEKLNKARSLFEEEATISTIKKMKEL